MDYFKLLHINNEVGLGEYLKTHDVNEEINEQCLLYWAVHENNFPFTQGLVQHGADVNKKDKLGRTALLIACYFGFYEIAKLLLQHGAIADTACFEHRAAGIAITNQKW